MALKADARALQADNERLRAQLAEVQSMRGAVTTVPVPGTLLETLLLFQVPCWRHSCCLILYLGAPHAIAMSRMTRPWPDCWQL